MLGVLSRRHVNPAPPGAQGYTTGFDIFSFELESFTVIERAEREFPELSPK
jgi:hypothetical protein